MDSDAERLPEGFIRIGYDADDQTYTFRAPDGRIYESEPGNRYGKLHPVDQAPRRPQPADIIQDSAHMRGEDEDGEENPLLRGTFGSHLARIFGQPDNAERAAIKKDTRDSARALSTFALLVLIFLILVFKLVNRPNSDETDKQIIDCGQHAHAVKVGEAESCWAIGKTHNLSIEEFLALKGNEGLDCHHLKVGQSVCVPDN